MTIPALVDQSTPSDEAIAAIEPDRADSAKPKSLFKSYLRLFREFRRNDLVAFCEKHDELYHEAVKNKNHLAATKHYYGLMASVIATYYGDGWHFCPPQHAKQSRTDATHDLYERIANLLGLESGKTALDIGCGVGGMMRYVARHSKAKITGITLGENEVSDGNMLAEQEGLQGICHLVQGDSQEMPFEGNSFDTAYAVYALKYYPTLDRVFSEIYRVLKPGGRFVAYCLCKSESYSAANPEHAKLLADFEYSTAMPSLHSVPSMMTAAREHGFENVRSEDISNGKLNWYSYWVRNPIMPWIVSSRLVYGMARTAEAVRILPRGFARFNDTFLAGTLRHIIRGGKSGVLTGSALISFEKPK